MFYAPQKKTAYAVFFWLGSLITASLAHHYENAIHCQVC